MKGSARSDLDRHYEAERSRRETVERVVAAMREQEDYPLPLQAMAEIAHLSPYHFARTFRRVTGIPPGEFTGALRMERAKHLLLTTDLSVSDVCFEVGYNSLGTFTTRFTQLVGVSPGRIRRLPEELYAARSTPGRTGERDRSLSSRFPADAGAAFRLGGLDLPGGTLIFAGLFPGAIPQGRPIAGTVVATPGVHRLAPVQDGCYHLMVAALPSSGDPLKSLLSSAALRVGRAAGPGLVRGGRAGGPVDVEPRPPRITDPPILIVLPALLLERHSRLAPAKAQDKRSRGPRRRVRS